LTLPDRFIERYAEGLIDTFAWRKFGITHWHLARFDAPVKDEARLARALVAGHIARGAACYDPRQALVWVMNQMWSTLEGSRDPERYFNLRGWRSEEDVVLAMDVGWAYLTEKTVPLIPTGGMVRFCDSHIAHIHAHPMTASRCRSHQLATV
jgi:hypothetical protein